MQNVERYDLNPGDFMKLDIESTERLVELAIRWEYRNDVLRQADASAEEYDLAPYHVSY